MTKEQINQILEEMKADPGMRETIKDADITPDIIFEAVSAYAREKGHDLTAEELNEHIVEMEQELHKKTEEQAKSIEELPDEVLDNDQYCNYGPNYL